MCWCLFQGFSGPVGPVGMIGPVGQAVSSLMKCMCFITEFGIVWLLHNKLCFGWFLRVPEGPKEAVERW